MEKKILIIDDEPVILTTMRDRLVMEGFDVVTAIDGQSGIAQAEKENPDLIVIDIMLPDMSGFDVCETVRKNGNIDSKIIIVTSKIDAVDASKARESGADDFTAKTVDYAPLIDVIRKNLEG